MIKNPLAAGFFKKLIFFATLVLCTILTGCSENSQNSLINVTQARDISAGQDASYISVSDILEEVTDELMVPDNRIIVKYEPKTGYSIITEEEYTSLNNYIRAQKSLSPDKYDEAMKKIFPTYEEYRDYMYEIYQVEEPEKYNGTDPRAVFYYIGYDCAESDDVSMSRQALQRGVRALFGEDSDFPVPDKILENYGNGFPFTVDITYRGEDSVNVWGWARGWGSIVDKEQDISLDIS